MNPNIRQSGEDKDLRRARNQFDSAKTQKILTEAIRATGATVHDADRILAQLRSRLRNFKLGKMKAFRPAVIAWATKQGQLNVALRELLQQPHPWNPTLLFTALPTYDGEVNIDALRAWAELVTTTAANAVASVATWVSRYQKAVYRGVWSVLKTCPDLGVGEFHPFGISDGTTTRLWHPTVEEIAAPVWLWMWQNAYDLATSEVPIHIRLMFKARRAALLWKLERVAEKRTFVGVEMLDSQTQTVERLGEADPLTLSESQRKLLKEAEYIGINGASDVDRAFAELDDSEVASIMGEDDNLETLAEIDNAETLPEEDQEEDEIDDAELEEPSCWAA